MSRGNYGSVHRALETPRAEQPESARRASLRPNYATRLPPSRHALIEICSPQRSATVIASASCFWPAGSLSELPACDHRASAHRGVFLARIGRVQGMH